MKPINKVLLRLEGVRGDRAEWKARCPAHDDRKPSLSVTEANNGNVLLKCFAGCDTRDVLQAIGLEWSDVFADDGGSKRQAKVRLPKTPRRRQREIPKLPNDRWQQRAVELAIECHETLYTSSGADALAYLRQRGFSDQLIYYAGLGYHPAERYEEPEAWGLPDREKRIWIPKGITVPWPSSDSNDVTLWRLKVRRAGGKPKYAQAPGGGRGLYLEQLVKPSKLLVLCEGEMDALSVIESAHVPAVATGSASAGRLTAWIARIASAPHVLVAFDADEAGDRAAEEWTNRIPHARRLRPTRHDVNDMLRAGDNIRGWIEQALESEGDYKVSA